MTLVIAPSGLTLAPVVTVPPTAAFTVSPTPTPVPTSASTTSAWVPVATLTAAVIAALVAAFGAWLQRRSGREAAAAASQSADAAKMSAEAAGRNAQAAEDAVTTERTKWRREQTLVAAAAMLDSLGRFKELAEPKPAKADLERLLEANREFNASLALLRLVASPELLVPAGALGAAQMRLYLGIFNPGSFGDVDHYNELDSAEGRFVNAARREFGLSPGSLESE